MNVNMNATVVIVDDVSLTEPFGRTA